MVPPLTVIIDLGEFIGDENSLIKYFDRLNQERGDNYQFVSLRSFEESNPNYIYHPFCLADRTSADMVRDADAIVWQPHTPQTKDLFEKLVQEGYTGRRILLVPHPGFVGYFETHATSVIPQFPYTKEFENEIYSTLEKALKTHK